MYRRQFPLTYYTIEDAFGYGMQHFWHDDGVISKSIYDSFQSQIRMTLCKEAEIKDTYPTMMAFYRDNQEILEDLFDEQMADYLDGMHFEMSA